MMCRELNKVYTNGTLVDEELLTDEQAGHCVSIRESDPDDFPGASTGMFPPSEQFQKTRQDYTKKRRYAGSAGGGGAFGICVLDSATSEFNLCAFEDDVCRTRLETLMRQLRVKEIVFTKVRLLASYSP